MGKNKDNNLTFESFLIKGLYYDISPNVRRYFTHTFYLLGKIAEYNKNEKFTMTIIKILLNHLPE